jgi:hypothetical protein
MRCAFLSLVLCCGWISAQEKDWDDLKSAASKYIEARSEAKVEVAWAKKFDARVDARVESTGLTRDVAVNGILLDWFTDNQSALQEKKEPEILEVCRLFLWVKAKRLELPEIVKSELEKDDRLRVFSGHLLAQAAPRTAKVEEKRAN